MFTLYIHCLEVLAMKAEGATTKTICDMGCEWSRQKIGYALYELEQEGYVTRDTSGKAHVWQITEKACEYCERIARFYNASHVMDNIGDYVRTLENDETIICETTPENIPSDDTEGGSIEVLEHPPSLNYESTKISFPLYGDKTIAEYVNDLESIANVKVTRADLANDIVTLTVETSVISGDTIAYEHVHSGICSICYHYEDTLNGNETCALCADNYDQEHHLGQYAVDSNDDAF